MERNNLKPPKAFSKALGTPVDKRGNAFNVPFSIKAGSTPAISVGGKVARRSRGAGVLSHSHISKQYNSGASEGKPAGGSSPPPPSSSLHMLQRVGELVSPVLR